MKRSIFQFCSFLRLSACFFALVCLSSVGYASAPSETDNVHFCLPFDIEQRERDRQYVARKQVLNLNVGEPRTVRLIYILPNDRPFSEEVVQNMKDEIRQIQTFYAEQMQAHGHGAKTFRFETDAQGEPLIHRVDGQHPDSHYTLTKLLNELENFDLNENIYLVVLDRSVNTISGVRGNGSRWGENGGLAMLPGGVGWLIAAHELGHAFGLQHDFNSDTYMMSYGSHPDRLSATNAEYLTVHPYFNSGILSNTDAEAQGTVPTIELTSPKGYPAGSNSVSVQLKLSDAEGLHQVILFVATISPHPSAGASEVKTYRALEGKKDAVIEFDYDGVIPSFGYTSLSDPLAHPMYVRVVDTDGNVSDLSFSLSEISPYHIAILEEHTKIVESIAFSPDETIFASGSHDGTIGLWDVATGKHIATLEGSAKRYPVRLIAFSPDGTLLASQSDDRKVKLWDVSTRENIATFQMTIRSLFFKSDGTLLAASQSDDHKVKLWDVSTEKNITTTREGHTDVIWSMAFSSDGTLLASGSKDKTVKLWDVATGENIATFEGHERKVTSLAFSPDGTLLASGSPDVIRLWDVATRTHIATLGHPGSSNSIAFSPDGTILAASVYDKTGPGVRLWDVSTRTTIAKFHEESSVMTIAFSPDGARLVSGSWPGEINLWDTSELVQTPRPQSLEKISGDNQQGTPRAVLTNPYVVEVRDQDGNPVQGAQVTFTVTTGDGKLNGRFDVENVTTDANGRAEITFGLGSHEGTNTVKAFIGEIEVIFNATGIETPITPAIGGAYQKWNLPDGAIARLGKGSIGEMAFSPDGQRLAVASGIGVWLYDVATSRELALLTEHTGVNAVAFSPDGTTIASGSNTVKLWDVATGENIATLEGHTRGVNAVAFSPNGRTLASAAGYGDETIILWDVSTHMNIATLEGHTSSISSVAFSPDGTTIASGSIDNTVKLWDVSTSANIATLEEHGYRVNSVVFSPDGKILASGSDNGIFKLWDVATRESIATHKYIVRSWGGDDVNSIAFSPDGTTFAVATNNYVNLLDVATRKKIATVEEYKGITGSVAFSPDGATLAILRGDRVKLWGIETENISILRHKQLIGSVAYSPDGTMLASNSGSMVKLWDVATRTDITTLEGRVGSVVSMAFSPDGTMLAGAGGKVYLWDISTRRRIATLDGRGSIHSVAYSPDGTMLAFGFPDRTVKLWDVATEENIATLEGHTDWVRSVAYSPSGRTLASGSSDGTVKLWDVSTEENIATLEGHTDWVLSVAYSPDGTTLASGSWDRTVKLWDISTHTNIATLEGHTNSVTSVSYSPDGTALAVVEGIRSSCGMFRRARISPPLKGI